MLGVRIAQTKAITADQRVIEFFENPSESISKLYDVERVIINILGQSTNPLPVNVVRKKFIEALYQNMVFNLEYLGTEVRYNKEKNADQITSAIDMLKADLYNHFKDDPVAKAKLLTKIFKKYVHKTSTRRKLIPSFEYFDNAISDLLTIGLVEARPASDKRGEVAYYLRGKVFNAWFENRVKLANKPSGNKKDLVFYGLTGEYIKNRHILTLKVMRASPNRENHGYHPMSLTEEEGTFLFEYLRANGLEFDVVFPV